MLDAIAHTLMTTRQNDCRAGHLTRVRDVPKWDAPAWWRTRPLRRRTFWIDLDRI